MVFDSIKKSFAKRSAENREIRNISRTAMLDERKKQAGIVARERVRIQAQSQINLAKTRAGVEPKKVFVKSTRPKNIKKKLRKFKKRRKVSGSFQQAVLPQAQAQPKFNPITGRGLFN